MAFDDESLKRYIYNERDLVRINHFENLLSDNTTTTDNTTISKLINHYFDKPNDINNNNINLILRDFDHLCIKYKNYQNFLLSESEESLTKRKFLLILIYFMERREKFMEEKTKLPMLIMLIKLWTKIIKVVDTDIIILRKNVIPLLFSKGYANYDFYKYYFSIIKDNNVKNDFYDSFLDSIINFPIDKNIVDNVNSNLKLVLKKHSRYFPRLKEI